MRATRYCISNLEENMPDEIRARTYMRRRACCDCGRTVLYSPAPILWELLATYLIICTLCAHERTIEAGDMSWTYDVRPRPKPGLD